LESAQFFPSFEVGVQRTWKVAGSHQKFAYHSFCRASNFPSKMFDKLVPGCIWLCAPGFESAVYGEICIKIMQVLCK